MRVHVHGVGVAAPGMGDWLAARAVLSGQSPHAATDVSPGSPAFLPANERRRVSRTIKLALQVAHEAVQTAMVPLPQIAPVFASAWGDLEIMDRILTALAQPERPVSPTHFHNSVHNAAAGYWSIGMAASQAVVAIAADQVTFSAGLLEAATIAVAEGHTTLLVAYDVQPPLPLRSSVPVGHTFAAALLLSADSGPDSVALDLAVQPGTLSPMREESLEQLRQANPAATALPLLQCLAARDGVVDLPYHGASVLRAAVRPAG